ncbi:hypothetical protein IZU99_06860 [Oscillospiraceae bacterium CM]|nr:hypothetical protein IZU99_06860 [Oscillospiraceae bacterium CM]
MKKTKLLAILLSFLLLAALLSGCVKKGSPSSSEPSPSTAADLAEQYRNDLAALSVHDSGAVLKALNQYKALAASADQAAKDAMFEAFLPFYELAQHSLAEKLADGVDLEAITAQADDGWYYPVKDASQLSGSDQAAAALIRDNGFAAYQTEGYFFLDEDPGYLINNFKSSVSTAVTDYLTLRHDSLVKGPLISDAGLTVSWDELSDLIATWENYATAHPGTRLGDDALLKARDDMKIYLSADVLDNTPMFPGGTLDSTLKASYARFIKAYPASRYHDLISGYVDILTKNNYQQTDGVKAYLKDNGYPYFSQPTENTESVIASSALYAVRPTGVTRVSLLMTSGQPAGDETAPGGAPDSGTFELIALDKDGKTVSTLDLNKVFGEDALTLSDFSVLQFDDYNGDGYTDFTIGTRWGSNGSVYRIFTVTGDGNLAQLPVSDGKTLYSATFDMSAVFTRTARNAFSIKSYDNTTGKTTTAVFTWENGSFRLTGTTDAATN